MARILLVPQAMLRRSSSLLVLTLLCCHCGAHSPDAPPTANTAETPAPVEPVFSGSPPSQDDPSAGHRIGLARAPRVSTAAENAENVRALALLRDGDAAAAERMFRELAEANDTHVLFRFNHVCALTRLGRIDEAAREIRTLLAMDLPTIEPRYHEDVDLEALRRSEHAAGLTEHIHALRARYLEASGVDLIAYDEATWSDDAALWGERNVVYTQAGLLDAGNGRFVPRAPRFADAMMSSYDSELGVAFVVTGKGNSDGVGHVLRAALHAYWPVTGQLESIRLEDDGGGVGLVRTAENRIIVGWPGSSLAVAHLDGAHWRRAGERHPLPVPSRVTWHRLVSYGGPVLNEDAQQPGRQLRGNRLVTSERSIELGPGHAASDRHAIAATDDTVWVASQRGPCRDGMPFQRHFADRVILSGAAVQRMSEGDSVAHVRSGPDGAIYLQVGSTVRRYSDPAGDAWTPLPDRLLLIEPYDSGCDT